MTSTGERILTAATRVFAKEGFAGATTREIAREAKVNEVTLFRHFKNKEELLRQVVAQCATRFEHVFAEAPLETQADLRRTVQSYASTFSRMLRDNEEFVRTFYGELHRHLKLGRQLFVRSSHPIREKFVAYLEAAQKGGLVHGDLDVPVAADALTGMLLAGTIRRPLTQPVYSVGRYTKTCVELFLKGIEP
jgi:AcrR family transcriptional regulator